MTKKLSRAHIPGTSKNRKKCQIVLIKYDLISKIENILNFIFISAYMVNLILKNANNTHTKIISIPYFIMDTARDLTIFTNITSKKIYLRRVKLPHRINVF